LNFYPWQSIRREERGVVEEKKSKKEVPNKNMLVAFLVENNQYPKTEITIGKKLAKIA
jgi:hypothetical protein